MPADRPAGFNKPTAQCFNLFRLCRGCTCFAPMQPVMTASTSPPPWMPSLRREDEALLRGRGCYVHDVHLPGTLHVAFARSAHAHATHAGTAPGRCSGRCRAWSPCWRATDLGAQAMPPINPLLPLLETQTPFPLLAQSTHWRTWVSPWPLVVARTRRGGRAAAAQVRVEVQKHWQPTWISRPCASDTRAMHAAGAAHPPMYAGAADPPGRVPACWPWRWSRAPVARNGTPTTQHSRSGSGWEPRHLRVPRPTSRPHSASGRTRCVWCPRMSAAPSAPRRRSTRRTCWSRSPPGMCEAQCAGHPAVRRILWPACTAAVRACKGNWRSMPTGDSSRCRPASTSRWARGCRSPPWYHCATRPGSCPDPTAWRHVDVQGQAGRAHAAPGQHLPRRRTPRGGPADGNADRPGGTPASGIDPVDLRRRNLVPAPTMPCTTASGETLDSGDYLLALERACARFGYGAERARQQAGGRPARSWASASRCTSNPADKAGSRPGDAAPRRPGHRRQRVTRPGPGPRHHLCADRRPGAGLRAWTLSTVLLGDTASCPAGTGALASRSTAIGGSAIVQACREARSRQAAGEPLPITGGHALHSRRSLELRLRDRDHGHRPGDRRDPPSNASSGPTTPATSSTRRWRVASWSAARPRAWARR